MEDLRSQNASLLEEAVEFAGIAQALQIRVAANVLLVDVDVGHGALAVELLESILEVAAFGDLIELYDLDGGSKLLEGAFGSLAVRAVALGEDNDSIVVDLLLDLGSCVGHGDSWCR
jgi:hypothetical protein